MGAPDVLEPVAGGLRRVEARLAAELDGDNAAVAALVRPTILSGGKRLRPALALLVASFGDADLEALVGAAAGLELIHAATLIHDDLIDSSPTRRGVEAVHRVAGATSAILAGDHYLAKGLGLVAANAGGEMASRVAATVMRICAGELVQNEAKLDLDRTVDDYLAAVEGKTAALFEVSCEVGAAVAGLGEDQRGAAAQFGHDLGMAFQIADDLLDYTAAAATLGKPVAADLRDGTVTLPLMLALDDESTGGRLRALLSGGDAPDDAVFVEIVQLVRQSDGVGRARARAEEYARRAVGALDGFAPTPERAALVELSSFVVRRGA